MINESYVTGLRFKLMDLQSEALQTALANTAPRRSENVNSTFFLLTEPLGNLHFQGVLKSRYIAGQWHSILTRRFICIRVISKHPQRFPTWRLSRSAKMTSGWRRATINERNSRLNGHLNTEKLIVLNPPSIWHYSRYGLNPITLMLPVN